uniref:Ubiquitin-like domain-containing protein n=1 Tax=Solanum lycopersicum TaxID=4081 RepID=A0A3Q7F029_SOLLC
MDGGDTYQTVKDDSGDIAGGGETVTINIRCVNDSKLSVQVSLDSTVGLFKSILSQPTDISAEEQKVIYNGRILKDDQTLKSCGLEADHTVHLIRGSAAAASASATNVVNPNANQDAPRVAVPTTGGLFVRVGLF